MMNYCNVRRVLARLLTAAVFAAAAVSCTTADDSLGFDFVPDNQKMKIRRAVLDPSTLGGRRLLSTKLFRTDSVISSNISYGYFGAQSDPDFGRRSAGFLSQYLVVGLSDSTGFGYRPIFDSVQMLLSVASYKGDTLQPQKYNVYEVVGDFLSDNENADGEADTVFYTSFDPFDINGRSCLSAEPAFTFTFPDGKTTGPATTAVTMTPTPTGMSLIRRLMLMEGEYAGNDMTIYRDDEKWVNYFRGLCIVPDGEPSGEGAMFSTDLSASGFTIYGRNRREEDPELIRDTTQAVYYFYDSKAKFGNVSVNSVRRDYAGSKLDDSAMKEPDLNLNGQDVRPDVEVGYIEGMGGPVLEITFDDEFFRMLDELRRVKNGETGETVVHSNIGFNQVRMLVYIDGAQYDWEQNDPAAITPLLDASMSRLGLYTDYKSLRAVADYNYVYEKQYSLELGYGGYLSRSWGCYVLDVTAYVQGLWSSYRDLGEAEREAGDLSGIEYRTVYLAPEAYGLFGFDRAIVQGMDGGSNAAPIKMELTYTLIK